MKTTLGLRFVLLVVLVGVGCATPVGVKRISTQKAHAELTASVISSGKPSASTRRVLHRLGLFDEFKRDPAATLAAMHATLAPRGDAHSTQAEPDTIEEVRRILLEYANAD